MSLVPPVYHLLQLATNQEVQVQQDEAYGEIRVVIPGIPDVPA
jgi:chromatin segregation and condensation protein Rec8/ScpA/Scc1 (kleisin family)